MAEPAEAPYPLSAPPPGLEVEYLEDERVGAVFSGVAWINMQREWDEWKMRLEKVARERGVRMGLKVWLDPQTRDGDLTRANHIVQLQVDDPALPEQHRVQTVEGRNDWPQRAIWQALHRAGLVLERELPRRPVRDAPQA